MDQHFKSRIVFENEHFIIIDKKGGELSVPAREGDKDTRACLKRTLAEYLRGSEGVEVLPVHRLDFEVSGAILFAKTRSAQRAANEWFLQQSVQKIYQATTEVNKLAPYYIETSAGKSYCWKNKMLRGKKRAYYADYGKLAITYATCLGMEEQGNHSYYRFQLQPKTGRAHQLRLELAMHGYPILGDVLYGSTRNFLVTNPEAIALRAVEINFSACKEATTLFALPPRVLLTVSAMTTELFA
ncbi:MAG: RNA pseudouridine synthase [Oligoflexia bacterium]|nr:RNA pseudouridine synthase [Oligoflexia bacterium]